MGARLRIVGRSLPRRVWRVATHGLAVVLCLGHMEGLKGAEDEGRFSEYEIRVIRPKSFTKAKSLELGTELAVVMNQTFIYSYLATGMVGFHLNDTFGVEAYAGYGLSIDKHDKAVLKSTFDIKTQILRTEYIAGGTLQYTPMYGKFQLSSGKLVYYDTFIALGGGMTGVNYLYDHCSDPSLITDADVRARTPVPPDPTTVGYPTLVVGAGQRFFVSDSMAIKWGVRDYVFSYDTGDGACSPSEGGIAKSHQNVMMHTGVGFYF